MATNLSKNFSLEELIASTTVKNKNINNTPSNDVVNNLKRLCTEVLQPIRDKYEKSIIVSSGYRCSKLNTTVGGSKTSQHSYGQAADIKCTATKAQLFNVIKKMITK